MLASSDHVRIVTENMIVTIHEYQQEYGGKLSMQGVESVKCTMVNPLPVFTRLVNNKLNAAGQGEKK